MSEKEAAQVAGMGEAEAPEASADLAELIAEIVDDKLGSEIVAIDVRDYVAYTDYLIVATARNERQAKSIHDEVYLRLKRDQGLLPRRTEGLQEARWVLLDYLGCVLHIFVPEMRELYRLDHLWGEAPRLEVNVEGAAPSA